MCRSLTLFFHKHKSVFKCAILKPFAPGLYLTIIYYLAMFAQLQLPFLTPFFTSLHARLSAHLSATCEHIPLRSAHLRNASQVMSYGPLSTCDWLAGH